MKKNYFIFRKSWIVLLLLISTFTFSQTIKTWNKTNGGSWNTGTNWSPIGVPVNGDDVIINSDQSSEITDHPDITLRNLQVTGNCNLQSNAIVAQYRTITITGNFYVGAGKTLTLGISNKGRTDFTLASSATGIIDGTVFLNSYNLGGYSRTFKNDGDLTISTNGFIKGQYGNVDFSLNSGATLQIENVAGITTNGNTGAVQVQGKRSFSTGANYVYSGGTQNIGDGFPTNLTGSLTVNSSGTVTLDNNRTVANGGNIYIKSGIFAVGTNLTMASTSTINRSGGSMSGTPFGTGEYDVIYKGNSMNTTGEITDSAVRDVLVTLNTGQTLTNDSKAFAVKRNVVINQGNFLLQASDANYIIGNNLTVANTGTLTHNVSWDGTGKLLLVGGNIAIDGIFSYAGVPRSHIQMTGNGKLIKTGTASLSILTLATSGTISANGTVNVNDNFWAPYVNTGTFSTAGFTVNANGGLLVAGGTLQINGGTLNVTGGLQDGVDSIADGTVNFSAGTLNADNVNVGFADIATPNRNRKGVFTHSGGIANIGNLNIYSATGTSYNCNGTPTINISGKWINDSVFTAATGTVNFIGSSPQTINGNLSGTNGKFYNLNFNGVGGSWRNAAPMEVAAALTVTNGTLTSSPAAEIITNTCDVKSSGTLIVKGNSTLTVQNKITNLGTGRNFIVESDGNLIQVNNLSVNSGNITSEREFKIGAVREQYNYLGTPVAFEAGQSYKTIFLGSSATTVLYHNQANNTFATSSGANIPGRGSAVKEPPVTTVLVAGKTTAQFKGVPQNGEILFGIVNSDINTKTLGYNLVGNPYSSNIDLRKLYDINGGKTDAAQITSLNISPTFYLWDNNTNAIFQQQSNSYNGQSYALFNVLTGSNGTGTAAGSLNGGATTGTKIPTKIVKVGQGFMTRSLLSTYNFKFNNSIRTSETSSVDFLGKGNSATPDDRYWLKMTAPSGIASMIAVVYYTGGNNLFGAEDSRSVGNSDGIYSIVENEKIAINGRSAFNTNDTIPLGSQHFVDGNYTIGIEAVEGIFENGQNIYLKDLQTGIITNLSEGNYTFAANAGESTGRFKIIYRPETFLATNDTTKNQIIVYRDGTDVIIRSPKIISNVNIYDLSGKLMMDMMPNNELTKIDISMVPNGIYILRIKNKDGEIVNRKFIR